MPFVTNQGVRIYYETIGNGRPLVLAHGTFGCGGTWKEFGYVDALSTDRQLILIDSRGHGQSDKPHDTAAYDLALRTSDVIAVMDILGVQKADFFGYSMGGWIGFGLAKKMAERFRSFIIGGCHPYAESMKAFRDGIPSDIELWRPHLPKFFGGHTTPVIRTQLMANDVKALMASAQDRESTAEVLPSMTMPCMIFAGEQDPRFAQAKQCASELKDATFFSLPGCEHGAAWARSDLVLPHVKAFLR